MTDQDQGAPGADDTNDPSAAQPSDAPAAAEPTPPAEPTSKPAEVLITASGLSKFYGAFAAVSDVSFEVRRGQVVAFLGQNGAGKSTTMRMLTGMLAPDRGEARIAGLSVITDRLAVARRLGYLPENGPLYDEMTPDELLRFLGEARGLAPDRLEQRVAAVRDQLDLGAVMGKAIHKLSRGYRQRVGLAQTLLHEPDVLILDEPTTGLDPNQIRDVRTTIRELGRTKAVLLSTHILQEVEAIADRIVFINDGRIVFQGTVEELRRKGGGDLDAAFAAHTAAA
ncbi:MAG: ABC transporter ATP-binding protein [Planctomycetota bacterium]|nr:ABC transporter ATP-binding protein [Planctomycetota bacterium]